MTDTKKPWAPSEISVQLTREEADDLLSAIATSGLWKGNRRLLHQVHARIEETLNPNTIEVCIECGSPNVSLTGIATAINGGADATGDPDTTVWCDNCGENVKDTKNVMAEDVDDRWRTP